ncbi:MAG TPA: aminotransferase class V-fold PLP-dependent enzyme, partial [Chitinophagaceae bacterium]
IAKKKGVLFFTDATQAVGKVFTNVNKDGVDLMAFSAHKIYGPKGVGALYVRRKDPRVKLAAQIDGGGHERGMRSGTLNVPGIVGFGKASKICMNELETDAEKMRSLRDKLEDTLLSSGEIFLNGDKASRLPHISNLSFKHAESENLMMALNKDIAVSSGSACMSASPEPSYVLKALGLSDEAARSSLRFSLGRYTSEEEINYAIDKIISTLNKIKQFSEHLES